jgi:hypothetical protein
VSVINYDDDGILAAHDLDGSTLNSGFNVPSAAAKLCVKASGAATGDVIITGTVNGTPGDSETLALNGATRVVSTKLFSAISSIQLPTVALTTVDIGFADGSFTHTFKMPADQFAAPFYTVRYAPGGMWGEQYQDCRVSMLSLEFRGASFLRGATSLMGGLPTPVPTTNWNALAAVDGGPQFLSPVGQIGVPGIPTASVLSGAFIATTAIPLDEEFVVGRYTPESLSIVSRAFAMSAALKIADGMLFKKIMYDPAGGSAWLASILKENADFNFLFHSDEDAQSVYPKSGTAVNMANGRKYMVSLAPSTTSDNVYWSATPLPMRAQRQVVMTVTAMFAATQDASDPIVFTLVNRRASY